MVSRACLNFSRTWNEIGNIATSWSDWPTCRKPNGWVKDAFKNEIADKVLLPRGTRLYKFNSYNTLFDRDSLAKEGITRVEAVGISPWWSPYERFFHQWSKESGQKGSTDDPGWLVKKQMAKMNGVSVREWGRITSAVKENWNSLKYLMVVTLNVDAYGFFGGFTQMGRLDTGKSSFRFGNEGSAVTTGRTYKSEGMKERISKYGSRGTLAGGGTQFYIPNIRYSHVASWVATDLSNE